MPLLIREEMVGRTASCSIEQGSAVQTFKGRRVHPSILERQAGSGETLLGVWHPCSIAGAICGVLQGRMEAVKAI